MYKLNKKRKTAQANLITIILLILLVLVAIITIWLIVKNIIKEKTETAEIQQKLITENVDISNVNLSASSINITIHKGAGKIVVSSEQIVQEPIIVNVISVVDLSGSMAGEKLANTKNATSNFIDSVLNISGNKIGLVAYSTNVNLSLSHALSNDSVSLKNKVNIWDAPISGYTCICCGINEAITQLSESNKYKTIVVMSDGGANYQCNPYGSNSNGSYAKKDAIQAAQRAYNDYNIKVYSVGFGSTVDTITLQAIAGNGSGEYFFSNVSGLSKIYTQVYEEIIREYEEAEKKDHMKIIVYTVDKSSEFKIYDIPMPLEARTYKIDIPSDINISEITKIEIYPVGKTESGRLIIGPKLDSWINPVKVTI